MKKLITLYILIVSSVFAQQMEFTLEESLEMGMRNSKELKISQSKVFSSEAKVSEAVSQLLPRLSFGANYTRLSNVSPFQVTVPFSPTPIKIQDAILNNYGFNLTIQQPIFTGFRLLSIKKASDYNNSAQQFEYSKVQNETAFRIHQAFWNFYKAQKLVYLIEENLKALEQHLRDTQNFLDNGLVTKNDLLKIEVQYSNLELQKIDLQNNLNLARLNYNKAIGIELNTATKIRVNENSIEADNFNYEDLLSEAFDKRDEIKSIDFRIKAGEENLSAANAGWFPSLFLFGHFYYNKPNQRILPLEDKFNDTWDVGVSLNWDLWDWGNTRAKAAQAEQQLVQTQTSLELLKEGIETEVYRNYLKLQSEYDKIIVSKKTLEAAEENYRITIEKYTQQLATSSDLIDAEVERLKAQTQLATSIADSELAKVALEKAVGRRIY
jgi:outer membrane protein